MSISERKEHVMIGAELLVKCLEVKGVEYIFGIPGAKIDSVFNALLDSSIRLIVCRHEQNAVFMAAAYGRLTGKPGVVLVTSGPGVGNLTTGLMTATTEGDPVVAIGGNVSRALMIKGSHQSAENTEILRAVTKASVNVELVNSIPEIVENAFRVACESRRGASFISVPQDVLMEPTTVKPFMNLPLPKYGAAPGEYLKQAASLINNAKLPVLFLGAEASRPENTEAIRALLEIMPFAVVTTYQGAGVIPQSLLKCFFGRVGLFKNQPGDQVLKLADLIITIGFNSVEYDSEVWNANNRRSIIHLDYNPCYVRNTYQPMCELLGDIALNIHALGLLLEKNRKWTALEELTTEHSKLLNEIRSGKNFEGMPIHPLRFIYELHQVVEEDMTICCDIGSVYIWLARYFLCFRPHQILFSNGQQTLGVGLPWAIGCNYARPGKKIISISGDGGFLFSAAELETAVREKLHFVHFIWRDGSYNMVLEQEIMKYKRKSGVDLGPVNIPDFAKAFGALGFELTDPSEFGTLFKKAMQADKPVLIDVQIDYSDNPMLFQLTDPDGGH